MTKPKETEHKEEPKEKPLGTHSKKSHSAKSFDNKQQGDNINKGTQKNQVKPSVWDKFKKAESQPIIANIVAIVAVVISAILAVFTYYLYHIASGQVDSVVKAGNAAQSSAQTAIRTLQETKSYNKTYIKLQKEIFKSDSVSVYKKQKQDSMSFSEQIASLKESQKEFEISNNAYLQVSDFDTIKSSIFTLVFKIINVGNQPAKVTKIKLLGFIGPPKPQNGNFFFNKLKNAPFKADNQYFVKGYPTLQKMGYTIFGNDLINTFKMGKNDFFSVGEIVYKNLTTNKEFTYYFLVELTLKPNDQYNILEDTVESRRFK